MNLKKYREKRDFSVTSEPSGEDAGSLQKNSAKNNIKKRSEKTFENEKNEENISVDNKNGEIGQELDKKTKKRRIFVVQHHLASHDHYDFRLEWRDVLISFAVPKGPSFNPEDKRLAVRVEDHPLDYSDFEGTIPKDQYGGGTVMLWDEGTYEALCDFGKGLKSGTLKFQLLGKRLKGQWTLVQLKNNDKNWLLIKEKDDFAMEVDGISKFSTSVKTGRTMEEISRGEDLTEKKNPFKSLDVQLCKLVEKVPGGDDFLFEVKYDGYRIVAFSEGGRTRLYTRNHNEYTTKFQEVASAITDLAKGRAFVLDGEVISPDEQGKPDFQALQNHLKSGKSQDVVYMIFDLLALDGEDLRGIPLLQRKEKLEELLKGAPTNLAYCEHMIGSGQKFFEAVKKMHLEGIVCKKKMSAYRAGRTDDWLKCKCRLGQEFLVVGYASSNKRNLSALILGAYDGEDLVYVGRAGTGFDSRTTERLLKEFKGAKRANTPLKNPPTMLKGEDVFWLEPKFVAEIEYAEMTKDGVLRQASFKGMRDDKSPREVVLEKFKNGLKNQKNGEKIKIQEKYQKNIEKIDEKSKNNEKNVKKLIINENKINKNKLKDKNCEIFDDAEEKIVSKNNLKISKNDEKIIKNDVKIKKNSENNKNNKKIIKNNAKNKNFVCGIEISNPNRIIFEENKIEKIDVARYYEKVSKRMLNFLKGRPLSVVRCHGNVGETFFKKHPTVEKEVGKIFVKSSEKDKKIAEKIFHEKDKTYETNSQAKAKNLIENVEEEEYFYVEDECGLIEQVQLGTIEFHAWGVHAQTFDQPDCMVFDLDPDEELSLDKVRQGARDLKSVLDELSLKSFLKTSGGKGYHVVVPFEPCVDWQTFRDFSENVAHLMASKWPEHYTTNIRKDSREGKIFIDYLRNTRGATSVAPYSLRARAGAKVSMPISWAELDSVAPNEIDMNEAVKRLRKPDPWQGFSSVRQCLRKR